MRLESEHTHYRTRFEMYAKESPDDVLPHVLRVLYDWLCDKERKLHPGGDSELLRRLEGTAFDYHVDYPSRVSGECQVSRSLLEGMSCPNVYDGGIGTGEDAKLCSSSMTGDGHEGFPQYWAMDYDEPDTAIACKTPEEILELAESEGMSLTIDELEEVSGGHAWGNCSQVSTGHCSRE